MQKNKFTMSAVSKSVLMAFLGTGLLVQSGLAAADNTYAVDGTAQGTRSFAIGKDTEALSGTGNDARNTGAIGSSAKAYGQDSLAIGTEVQSGDKDADQTTEAWNITMGAKLASQGKGDIVIGFNSHAVKGTTDSIVIGRDSDAKAGSSRSIAMGYEAETTAANTLAIGSVAHSYAVNGSAVGVEALVAENADNGSSFGYKAQTYGKNSVAVGYNSHTNSSTTNSIALGANSKADSGDGVIALGANASAKGANSVALGYQAVSTEANTVSLGGNKDADGNVVTRRITNVTAGKNDTDAVNVAQLNAIKQKYAVDGTGTGKGTTFAIGSTAVAETDVETALAIGSNAVSYGNDSIAMGNAAISGVKTPTKNEDGTTTFTYTKWTAAIGSKTEAKADGAVALGLNSEANGVDALSVGRDTMVNGMEAVGVGNKAEASQASSVAMGFYAHATGNGSIAVGRDTKASAENSLALGFKAAASKANSIALGANSVASEENVVSIGAKGNTRKITNVTAGEADTDAVNVSQLKDYVSEQLKNAGAGSTTTINQGDNIKVTKGDDGSVTVGLDEASKTAVDNAKKLGDAAKINEGIAGDTVVDSINNLDDKVGNQKYSEVTATEVKDDASVTEAIGALNNKVGAVDEKVGDLADLNADIKGDSVVESINKLDDKVVAVDEKVGDLAGLNADIKGDSVVESINKLDDKVTAAGEAAGKAQTDATQALKDAAAAQGKADAAAAEAAKHTSVAAGNDNIKVTAGTNEKGGAEYTVTLADNISVKSLKADTVTAASGTIGGVEMKDGAVTATTAKIGDVTISGDTIATGSTTITGSSVAVGDSELTTDSLKVNGKEYITSEGINANNQTITNLAAGDISSASSTDAVTGGQLYATNQQVQANSDSIANLWKKTGDLNKKINRTGANAAALAALHPLDFDEDHKVSASVGVGQYHGTGALAVGVFVRPTENLMFNIGGSFASDDRMFNAGVSYRFGNNGASYMTKADMASKVNALQAENADLRAQLEAIKTRLNMK